MCRRDRQIHLSQLQWFSVVSALCRTLHHGGCSLSVGSWRRALWVWGVLVSFPL